MRPGDRLFLYAIIRAIADELRAWADAQAAPGVRGPPLRTVHRRLLEVLTGQPQATKVLARKAGYRQGSYVRTALAELVRWGLAAHGPDGYSLSATSPEQTSGDEP